MMVLQKRHIAWCITVLVILLSVIGGSTRGLSRLRAETELLFYQGSGNGYSINGDLNKRVDLSVTYVTIARKYMEGAEVDAVLAAMAELSQAASPSGKCAANAKLTQALAELKSKIDPIEMSEQDAKYRQTYYSDLVSRNMVIDNVAVEYNIAAEAFNNTLKRPPGVLAAMTGMVQPLEAFR